MKSKEKINAELIEVSYSYAKSMDYDFQEHANCDFYEGANYVVNTYLSPLLTRTEELEKCVRELYLILTHKDGSFTKWKNEKDLALSNAKKLLNNES